MKKTVWGLLFLAVIAIGILCPASRAMADDYPAVRLPDETTLTDWMKYLPDDAYLCNLNIPATHDSATRFVTAHQTTGGSTQDDTIEEQMYKGIRAFDIRYRYDPDSRNLILCHGEKGFKQCSCQWYKYKGNGKYGFVSRLLTVDHVAVLAARFLAAHPTETLILCVTRESGAQTDDDYGHENGEKNAIKKAVDEANKILQKTNHHVIEFSSLTPPVKWYLKKQSNDPNKLRDYLIKNTNYENEFQNSIYNLTMQNARGNLIIVESHIHNIVGTVTIGNKEKSLNDDGQYAWEKWAVVKPYLDSAKQINLTERQEDTYFLNNETTANIQFTNLGSCYGIPSNASDEERRTKIANERKLKTEEEKNAFFNEHPDYVNWHCAKEGHEEVAHPFSPYYIDKGNSAVGITGVFTSCHGYEEGSGKNTWPQPKGEASVIMPRLEAYDFKPGYYYGFIIMDCPSFEVISRIAASNFAYSPNRYIREIKGFAAETLSEAKAKCESQGYTVLNTNGICNVNPNGRPIVIGYKTTNSPFVAIRQITGRYGYYGQFDSPPQGFQMVNIYTSGVSDPQWFTRKSDNTEYTYLFYSKNGKEPITTLELVSSGGNVKVYGTNEIFNFQKPSGNHAGLCIELLTGTGYRGMCTTPENGEYIIYPAIDPAKCLAIAGGKDAIEDHKLLQIWDAWQTSGKVFTLTKDTSTTPVSYKIVATHSGEALEAANRSTAAGANIWQVQSDDSRYQRWTFEYAGNGNVYIRNLAIGGYVDVAGSGTANGTPIVSYGFTGARNQMFRLAKVADISEGDYYIYSALDPNMRLDIAGGVNAKDNGANLHIWSETTSTGSVFTIKKAPETDSYKITAKHSGKELSVYGNVAESGRTIHQWQDYGNFGQRWTFEDAGDGYVYIRSLFGLFTDVLAGGTKDGTDVIAFRYLGGDGQRFKLVSICDEQHVYKKTNSSQQPTIEYKTGKITYGWKEYYECSNGHFFEKYENGVLSGQIKDIEAWKNGEGRLGEAVKITFEDKNKTTVVYNLKGQKLPDYVFPMPVFDETSVFLEWQSPDQKHFDCTVETLSDMTITANRMAISDIYDQYNQNNYSALTTTSINRNTKRELSGKIYQVTQTPLETYKYLTVKDWAVIIIPDGYAVTLRNGIHVASGATLIIMSPEESMGTGSFKAYGTTSYAGIGGAKNESGGNVAVYNCNVVAKGGARAAAIGGGERGNGGAFYICGGTVRADGGIDGGTSTIGGTMNGGAGIGGGMYGGGAKVQLDGGEVYAYGAANAAGLGKGSFCEGDRWEEIHLGKSMRVWDITNGKPGVVLQQVTPEILNSIKSVHIAGLGDDDGKYTIIKGANQAICKDAVSAMFASDADFLLFDHVEVDGKAVPREYYAAMPGSTVITFNSSLISSLSLGEHNLRIVSKDGFAATDFTVIAPLPKTGDSTNLSLLVTLLIASTGMILLMSVKAKKKRL